MPDVLYEGKTLGDWLVMEGERGYSRENVTLLAGTKYVTGQPLGVITVGGKYTIFNQDAADGTEEAAGILVHAVDASAADQPGVAIVRHAQYKRSGLTWPADIDAGEITAAIVQLTALGLIERESN